MGSDVYLGTANWGVKTSKTEAFNLLDLYIERGFTLIDSSTNYPIDGHPLNHGLALKWIQEWIKINPGSRLKIFLKIGSVSNRHESKNNLSSEFINECLQHLTFRFSDNLFGVGIHWDNRNYDQLEQIRESLEELIKWRRSGLTLGLSGIRYPEAFQRTALIDEDWLIQFKEYPGFTTEREKYQSHLRTRNFVAYGISHYFKNYSNLKFTEREQIFFSAIDYFLASPNLSGFVVAPRNREQLLSLIKYMERSEPRNR